MTFEEFKQLAETQGSFEGETFFRLDYISIIQLERKKMGRAPGSGEYFSNITKRSCESCRVSCVQICVQT